MPAIAQDLGALIDQSAATPEFKEAVRALRSGRKTDAIRFNYASPPVKVMRVITKLLEDQPQLEIREVEVRGQSGCSEFVGTLLVNGEQEYRFTWDCKWRAEQEGLIDHW